MKGRAPADATCAAGLALPVLLVLLVLQLVAVHRGRGPCPCASCTKSSRANAAAAHLRFTSSKKRSSSQTPGRQQTENTAPKQPGISGRKGERERSAWPAPCWAGPGTLAGSRAPPRVGAPGLPDGHHEAGLRPALWGPESCAWEAHDCAWQCPLGGRSGRGALVARSCRLEAAAAGPRVRARAGSAQCIGELSGGARGMPGEGLPGPGQPHRGKGARAACWRFWPRGDSAGLAAGGQMTSACPSISW